jgi:hypothetical protein
MRAEYRSDKSLTELTVLDGEDFIDDYRRDLDSES